MKIPTLEGTIKRRILVNFRADPDAIQRVLPNGFTPKLHNGKAVVGICLIRLEHIRPKHAPEIVGLSSENAAHRIAVEWNEGGERREGVYIPRRDTDSALNALAGGTLFPGEHNRADFSVSENDGEIDFAMKSRDEEVSVALHASNAERMPYNSIFENLDDASEFFKGGAVGYSVARDNRHLDGIELETAEWKVDPLNVEKVSSSFYDNESMFPAGAIEFDHALIMRNVKHEWHAVPDYALDCSLSNADRANAINL